MKKILISALAVILAIGCTDSRSISSPDRKLKVKVDVKAGTYDMTYARNSLQKGSEAQLRLPDGTLAWSGKAKVSRKKNVSEHIQVPFYRQDSFDYDYNAMTLDFGNGFQMEWRVSNDGAAYRFLTTRDGNTTIMSETAAFKFPQDWEVTLAKSGSMDFKCSFEGFYDTQRLTRGCDSLCFMPASVATGIDNLRVTIAESSVIDFPGSFIIPVKGESALEVIHAPVPEKDIIASSTGARSYPWRILKVTTKDTQLPVDNLICALAEPSKIEGDLSWIRPGFSAWEWWNDWGLKHVNFTPGINDETYRHYIDFAADHGLEYVLLDEGWGKRGPGQNLLTPIPGLHLQELSEYAQSKGVRLILWAVFDRLQKDAENVFSEYEKMGIAGFKPDFFNRNDQVAVEQICEVAEIAARHHMFLDIHGTFPPMGLTRTYPNILNMEGICGLEAMKGLRPGVDFMKHDVNLAFLRTMAGVSDYTPGAMTNCGAIENFVADYSNPESEGTRAHQVALYGIFDSPLTMLCDSPYAYEENHETTAFIASLPRTYSQKKVLAGRLGEYIVVARKSGDNWYVFGINNFTERDIDVNFWFLRHGNWHTSIFRDIVDNESGADLASEQYFIENSEVGADDSMTIPTAPGGGFVIKLCRTD